MSQSESSTGLQASYSSPSNAAFSVSRPLPASDSDKTEYLIALREAVVSAQEEINKELTQRMDEDKNGKDGAVDDKKEEENYGEEVVEED